MLKQVQHDVCGIGGHASAFSESEIMYYQKPRSIHQSTDFATPPSNIDTPAFGTDIFI